jgi:hypothetical protein
VKTKYAYPEKAQFKLWLDRPALEEMTKRAGKLHMSANGFASMILMNAIVGKPRIRVKMGRAVV